MTRPIPRTVKIVIVRIFFPTAKQSKRVLPFPFKSQTLIEEERVNQKDIDNIKTWIKSTTIPKLQDEFIAIFLISCLNNVDLAKKKIEAYFKIKNQSPLIFNGLDVEEEQIVKILKVGHLVQCPKKMDNNMIFLLNLIDTNYRNLDIVSLLRLVNMLQLKIQLHDPLYGIITIIDAKGIGFKHLACLKMNILLSFLEFVQEAMPLKVINIHILNSSYIIEKVLNMVKMLLPGELVSLIETHPQSMKMEEFHKKWVPACYLPEDYEGDLPSMQTLAEETVIRLKTMKPFFEAEEKLRSRYKIK